MAGWLIDKTPLIAIRYDLLREVRVGNTVLHPYGLHDDTNAYVRLLADGISTGWLPEMKKTPNVGAVARQFNILLLNSVSVQLCKQVAAFQMGRHVYKKKAEVPYDNVSTPAEWVFSTDYIGIHEESEPDIVITPPTPPDEGESDSGFTFTQSVPATEWVVNHNLGYYPDTNFVGLDGTGGLLDVFHVSVNQLRVYFAVPTAGQLLCN